MVNHCRDTPEESLLIDLANRQAVRAVVDKSEVRPPARHDRAAPERPRGFDHHSGDVFGRSPDATQTEVERRFAGIEKLFLLR